MSIELPGVPEGYRALRWGVVGKDQWLVQADGTAVQWPGDTPSEGQHLVVEPVKTTTRTVVFHEVVLWDNCSSCKHVEWVDSVADAMEVWEHGFETGNTREVEVPCDE